jgi:hypothetical protein
VVEKKGIRLLKEDYTCAAALTVRLTNPLPGYDW